MADKDLTFNVKVNDQATGPLGEIEATVERVEGAEATVDVTATDEASAVLEEDLALAEALDGTTASIDATVDDQATADLEAIEGAVEQLDGAAPAIAPTVDDSALAELQEIEGAVEELDGASPEITPTVDPSGLSGIEKAAEGATESTEGLSGGLKFLEGRLSSSAGEAGKLIDALGGVSVAGPAAAVLAVGFATEKSAEKFENLALAAQHFSVTSGATIDEASRWIEVAGDLGVSADTVESAIGRMNKGIGQGTLDLASLGITAGSSSENFTALLAKLRDTTDAAQRAALGSQAFGRGWQVLAPIIDDLDSVNERLASVSEQKVITDEEVAQAKEFRDAMDSLHDAIEDVEIALGQFAIGPLTDAAAIVGNLRNDFEALKDSIPGGNVVTDFLGPMGAGSPMRAAKSGLTALRDLTDPEDWGWGSLQDGATGFANSIPVIGDALGGLIGGTTAAEEAQEKAAKATAKHNAELAGQGTLYLMGANAQQVAAVKTQALAKTTAENAANAKIAAFQEKELTKTHEEAVKALDAHRRALSDLDDQLNSNRLDAIAVNEAQIKANQALREYDKTMKDSTVSAEDKNLATSEMTAQLLKTAQHTGDAAAAQSGLALETDKTILSIDTQISYLDAVAATLAPNSPLLQEIAAYKLELEGIKEKINTEVTIDTEKALAQLRALQAYITEIEGGIDIPIGFTPVPGTSPTGGTGGGGGSPRAMTVNQTITAGFGTDRFALQKAIRKGNRDLERLAGVRR